MYYNISSRMSVKNNIFNIKVKQENNIKYKKIQCSVILSNNNQCKKYCCENTKYCSLHQEHYTNTINNNNNKLKCKYEGIGCNNTVLKKNKVCINCLQNPQAIKLIDDIILERQQLLNLKKYDIVETYVGHKNNIGKNAGEIINNYWLLRNKKNKDKKHYAMYCYPNKIISISEESIDDVVKYTIDNKTKYYTWYYRSDDVVVCRDKQTTIYMNKLICSKLTPEKTMNIDVIYKNDNVCDNRIKNLEWSMKKIPIKKEVIKIDEKEKENIVKHKYIDNDELKKENLPKNIYYFKEISKITKIPQREFYTYFYSYKSPITGIKTNVAFTSSKSFNHYSIEEKKNQIITKKNKFEEMIKNLDKDSDKFNEQVNEIKNIINKEK